MVCVLAGIRSETSLFALPRLRSPARTSAEVKATAANNSSTMYATRWERFVVVTVMLFSLLPTTGINKFHPSRLPPGIALVFSLESSRCKLEELHSADAPAASRKPERGKRSFIDPNLCVPMCTPCAEPTQKDQVDLTRSVTATCPLSPPYQRWFSYNFLSLFPQFVM
jgi:hypothetical protein